VSVCAYIHTHKHIFKFEAINQFDTTNIYLNTHKFLLDEINRD